jgi:hypothetical protein
METVWLNHDNTIEYKVYKTGTDGIKTLMDLSTATRMTIEFGTDTIVDSDVVGKGVDFPLTIYM